MLRGYFTFPRLQIWTKPQFRVKNGRRMKYLGPGRALLGLAFNTSEPSK